MAISEKLVSSAYVSNRMGLQDLLEKSDKKLFKVRSVDPNCPLSKIILNKKETKYNLRNRTVHHPEINLDRFKNVFVNRLVFTYIFRSSFG